jgi:hypothetical protein
MTAEGKEGALGGRGGVKIGDFGVGGRVYSGPVYAQGGVRSQGAQTGDGFRRSAPAEPSHAPSSASGPTSNTSSTPATPASTRRNNLCAWGALCLVGAVVLFLGERSAFLLAGCVDEAVQTAVVLARPVGDGSARVGSLVFVASDPSQEVTLVVPPPLDPFFNVAMPPGAAMGRRVTEYCQWEQVRGAAAQPQARAFTL